MEFDLQTNRPLVRIGSLQSERKMSFRSHVPFLIEDHSGKKSEKKEANRKYELTIVNSYPPIKEFKIRLAICYDHQEAEKIANSWQGKNLEPSIETVGENIQIAADRYIDNREHWIVAGDFESFESADEARRNLPDFGSYQVLQFPTTKASGTLQLDGETYQNWIKLIPLENSRFNFALDNVRVGIGFHWDHRESQEMEGDLEFHIDKKGLLTAVNVLYIEQYLASVNSSEMVPDCNLEFLKAQTVVARCTVFATAGKHHYGDPFDLCADDHCQCFHGAGAIQEKSLQAAQQTCGKVLMYDGRVCDTRYAKVCAGIGESYGNVWDNRQLNYLNKFFDCEKGHFFNESVDNEENFRNFIKSSPDVFCNPDFYQIPKYLEYANDYFRWKVYYSPEELGKIVANKLGRNLGPIIDIIPLKRGDSGRIVYARLVGELGDVVIGKELEIRKVLSNTHLYSACFYIERELDPTRKVNKIWLKGGGWGHGVGICQVGAAVMGEEGYNYNQILDHYYNNTAIETLYK